jgi:mRNA-degrading endonuclease RelE of RelBE toxin-antitoxin system
MNYKIIVTRRFAKEMKRLAKKYPSLKREYAALIDTLTASPFTGTLLRHHCYKIRLSIASKGKGESGGARIITCVYARAEMVYLLTIYDKSEIGGVTDGDLSEMVQALE